MSPRRQHPGAVAIILVLGISSVVLAVLATVTFLSTGQVSRTGALAASETTYFAAETGINRALYGLVADPAPTTFCLDFQGGSVSCGASGISIVQVDVTAIGFRRRIVSTATDRSGISRVLTVRATVSSFSGGTQDAVTAGPQGFVLDQNAIVSGAPVHTHGNITGGNNAEIHGDVYVGKASPTTFIDNVDVWGTVRAHTIKNLAVAGGDAYYATPADWVASTISGGTQHPGSPDPDPNEFPLPIVDSDLPALRTTFTAEGAAYSGDLIISTSTGVPLSYSRINGDLTIRNGVTVILDKDLYVAEKLVFQNPGATLQLDPSVGANSRTILTDGVIDMKNNANINGSGDPHSFLMLLSASPSFDVNDPAIFAHNNLGAAIFYAVNGLVRVYNGSDLHNATGQMVKLDQTAHVTYDPNLQFFTITPGSPSAVTVDPGTWAEL